MKRVHEGTIFDRPHRLAATIALFSQRLPHTLPAPRPVLWPLKPLESARTTIAVLPDGRLEMAIQHEVVAGVTPEMLNWWFHHIDEAMEYCGQTYPRYLVWHPLDHIAFEVLGTPGQRETFHITEMFGRNPHYFTDVFPIVEQCDQAGVVLVDYFAGMEIGRLHHRFREVAGGTQYDSRLLAGPSLPLLGKSLNRLLRPRIFSTAKAEAWLRHNVEEVGNLEHFLPGLYASRVPEDPSQ